MGVKGSSLVLSFLSVVVWTWWVPATVIPGEVTAEMVLVEGGGFMMGDVFGDGEADELPVHQVSVESYHLGKYEVTVGEFREFVELTGYKTTAELNGGADVFDGVKMTHDSSACWHTVNFDQGEDHPVVGVSWYDAVVYCNWRSENERLKPCYVFSGDSTICDFEADGYRLPTEAEWEYAARSRGKDYKYAWGNGEPYIDGQPAGNVRDEAAKRGWKEAVKTYWKGYDDGYLFSSPVDQYAPNEIGLHDMTGNVYEWCWDWYDSTYYAISPEDNPQGPEAGEMRCCRSVGYGCFLISQRVVNRGKAKPDFYFLHGGFRLARSH